MHLYPYSTDKNSAAQNEEQLVMSVRWWQNVRHYSLYTFYPVEI